MGVLGQHHHDEVYKAEEEQKETDFSETDILATGLGGEWIDSSWRRSKYCTHTHVSFSLAYVPPS